MTRALLALAVLATIVAAITLATQRPGSRPPTPARQAPSSPPAPSPTPAPARLERATVNRQDRTSRRQRRLEARAFDARPLLSELPLELADVRIDIAALAADGRTVLVSIDPGPRSRAFAMAVYRRALAACGDPGRGYELEWAR